MTSRVDDEVDGPSISVSGYKGARAIRSPPKPQPTSAHSTCLRSAKKGELDDKDDKNEG